MKVNIKKYNAVASWKWDLPEGSDDTCGICRVEFEGTCSKCKYPGDDCPIMIGDCSHSFHVHCIEGWLQADSSQGRCPMCRQTFRQKVADVKKSGGGSGNTGNTPSGSSRRNNSESSSSSSSSTRSR